MYVSSLTTTAACSRIRIRISWSIPTGTTYKLKLNHGDIKATQGDTGHAQPDMVTEVYSHILDEDRKINAQRFEAGFYANPDMRGVERSIRQKTPVPTTLGVLRIFWNNAAISKFPGKPAETHF